MSCVCCPLWPSENHILSRQLLLCGIVNSTITLHCCSQTTETVLESSSTYHSATCVLKHFRMCQRCHYKLWFSRCNCTVNTFFLLWNMIDKICWQQDLIIINLTESSWEWGRLALAWLQSLCASHRLPCCLTPASGPGLPSIISLLEGFAVGERIKGCCEGFSPHST